MPLLHTAVEEKSQKVVEYLLSQDFVDKTICSARGNNIYHVLCRIRGAEELFSIIERKVPHHLLLNYSRNGINAFHIACEENNVIIVKRVYEILESLQLDITKITKSAMNWAMRNKDVEVIKYVLSIRGVQLTVNSLSRAIRHSTFDIVVYLLNVYLCDINNSENNHKELVELNVENLKNLINIKGYGGNRIWHAVSENENLDVVQLIFSLNGIQAETLNDNGYNIFLLACELNSNIKVIKYIHKLFPSLFNSQLILNGIVRNGASLVFLYIALEESDQMDRLKILHYLYLNGIDIHLLWKNTQYNQTTYQSIYSQFVDKYCDKKKIHYLKVISQDFDYLQNEHDNYAYCKPSFWKEIDKYADEQSKRVNEWKNRYEEHVLRNLSKMIQEHMLKQNQ